jgi:hypothetical protein
MFTDLMLIAFLLPVTIKARLSPIQFVCSIALTLYALLSGVCL